MRPLQQKCEFPKHTYSTNGTNFLPSHLTISLEAFYGLQHNTNFGSRSIIEQCSIRVVRVHYCFLHRPCLPFEFEHFRSACAFIEGIWPPVSYKIVVDVLGPSELAAVNSWMAAESFQLTATCPQRASSRCLAWSSSMP